MRRMIARVRRNRWTPEEQERYMLEDIAESRRRIKIYTDLGKALADYLSVGEQENLRHSEGRLADFREKKNRKPIPRSKS
jgi:hypothetical protein